MLKKFFALAGGVATALGLYLLLVQTTALSVTLDSLDGDGADTAMVNLSFANEGDTDVTVLEVELYFADSLPGQGACIGSRFGREVFSPTGDAAISISAGEQDTRTFEIHPGFTGEGRYGLCGIFEVRHRKGSSRSQPILFFELSVIEGEFDGKNLDRMPHTLIHTRNIRRF